MIGYWIGGIALGLVGLIALALLALHVYVLKNYIPKVSRIFQEKPFFNIPYGRPVPEAEEIEIPSSGVVLKAVYMKTRQPRKGVIFFGLEFGSKRWSALSYGEFLLNSGYDLFACETRGQGDTPTTGDYEPLQWITNYEVEDFRSALTYLKSRSDADPRGAGLFGLSKGGALGLFIGASDPFLRCFVTDGAFGTHTTMIPYIEQWVHIYVSLKWVIPWIPKFYYRTVARIAVRRTERERNVHYPSLLKRMPMLAPRPLFMVHGAADSYIKPVMATTLFDQAGEPKEFWLVEGAKHNQAFHLVGDEYKRRVLEFFERHLTTHAAPALSK